MDFDKLAELLAFFFTDFGFKGNATELWRSVIDLFQQIFDSIANLFS